MRMPGRELLDGEAGPMATVCERNEAVAGAEQLAALQHGLALLAAYLWNERPPP